MGKTKTAFIGETTEPKNKTANKRKGPKGDVKVRVAGLKGGERVKAVEGNVIETTQEEEGSAPKQNEPKERGKKYTKAKTKIEQNKLYSASEAIKLAKEVSTSSFEGSLELHAVLKKQGVLVNLELPYSFGKEKKVEVASDETVENLKKGKIDFDVLLATPDMMPKLVPFARILGPKGLMPNPKNGTLIKSAAQAKSFSSSKHTLKTQSDSSVLHTVIGKTGMEDKEIKANLDAVIKALDAKQILKAYLSPTMGPSVKLEV